MFYYLNQVLINLIYIQYRLKEIKIILKIIFKTSIICFFVFITLLENLF